MDNFLTSLIEGASDAIFVADVATGIITYANPAAGKLFECPTSELVGLHQTQLHPKEDLEDVTKKFRDFTTTSKYKEVTAYIITKTGKKKLVMITGANLFESDNHKYTSAYFKDISYVDTFHEIAYSQSHLVRRPLANILGLSKMLTDDTRISEKERTELLEELYEEAQQLDDMVKSVSEKVQLD